MATKSVREIRYSQAQAEAIKQEMELDSSVIIMGEDNYLSLETWIKSNYIKNNFEIIVYPRNKNSIDKLFFDGELLDFSSKQIREKIKSGKKVSGMVPDEVEKEIIKNGYYIR